MSGRGRGYGGRGGHNSRGGQGGSGGREGSKPRLGSPSPGSKRKRLSGEGATPARRQRKQEEEEEDRAMASQGTSSGAGRGSGRGRGTSGGMTRGQTGRHWSIQAAEAWGASEEALEFVAGKTGKEQSEREERRRARMRPQLRDEDKVALEAAGRTDLKEAMETVTGVLEDVYVAIGGAVGAVREENLEWKRDFQAHMAATDRQNRKRHLEFTSPSLKIPPGSTVTEEQCLQQLSWVTEQKYGVRLTWGEVAACHPLPSGKGNGRVIAFFKNTHEGSAYQRLLQPGKREGGVKGKTDKHYVKVEVSASSYDATIKDVLHWYKEHCVFMGREAEGKGMTREEAVPPAVCVTRYSCERLSAKIFVSIPSHRNLQVTSARELLQLVGQRCMDAFLMKVPAHTWITPRRENELPEPRKKATGGNSVPLGKGKKTALAGANRNAEENGEEEEEKGEPSKKKGGSSGKKK